MQLLRLKGWTFGVAALLCLPAYGAEAPEEPYRWTCKADGFFEMKVTPDGVAHPGVNRDEIGPIHITIRRRSEDTTSPDDGPSLGGFDTRYVVVVQQDGGKYQPFTNVEGPVDYYYSGVKFRFTAERDPVARRKGLKGVEAVYWVQSHIQGVLTLEPAEKDWVFFVYDGFLMTDVEARHNSITAPGFRWEAEATVHFLTGPCVREG